MNRINTLTEFKLFFAFLTCVWILPAWALEPAEKWQHEALHLNLAGQPAWLNLLHAQTDIWGNTVSQVDDDAFFLSPQGKHNVQAELMASIKAFVENNQIPAAQCRFPARFYWLQQQLKSLALMPATQCQKFMEWRDKVAANKVTLAFPGMYLNNPGSMFGHTFLRLDNNKKSPLLSYTLSYTARTDDNDSFLAYAYKGITGGYQGYFTTRPYYETLQEYGDIEHRDIWEYDLGLTQPEVDQMIRHLWELSGMNFDYFFLRENCAYRLLAILDVAKPALALLQKNPFPVYAIPVDTVRAVVNSGLVTHTHYRPAITSRLQQMMQQLDKTSQQQALLLADKKITTTQVLATQHNIQQQAKILQFASEIRQFKKQKNDNILLARSHLNIKKSQSEFVYTSNAPQQAHDSARWSLSVGQEENQSIVDFSIRTAFHDLLDRPDGFLDGISITGLDVTARWFADEQNIKLQQFNFFSMTSLSPVTAWSTPLSGKLTVSMQRYVIDNGSITPFELDAGLGFSKKLSSLLFYGLVSVSLDYSTRFNRNFNFYAGAEMGLLWQFEGARLLLSQQNLSAVSGADDNKIQSILSYQYDVSRDDALSIEWKNNQYLGFESNTTNVKYLHYF